MCKTCRYLLPCGAIQYQHTISCFDRNCTDLETSVEDVVIADSCEVWKAHVCLNDAWASLILEYANCELERGVVKHAKEEVCGVEDEGVVEGERKGMRGGEGVEEGRWLGLILRTRY